MAIGQQNIVDLPGAGGDDKKSKPPPQQTDAARERADRDLRARLDGIFGRIAEAAEARGDAELAEIIREDAQVMATGLVSLTRPIRALRSPLILLLGIVEPFMAFSRVGRVMFGRWYERRSNPSEPTEPPAA